MSHYECSLPCNDREPATVTEWRERVSEVMREAAAKVANAEHKYASELHRLRSELAQARAHIIALEARAFDRRPLPADPDIEATGPAPGVPYNGAPSPARAAKLAKRRTHA